MPTTTIALDSAVSQLPMLGHLSRCLACWTHDFRAVQSASGVQAGASAVRQIASGHVVPARIAVFSVSQA